MDGFSIKCENLRWIDDTTDDPEDLCAHGSVTVRLGEKILRYDCCVSASALQMLRTLTEDHVIEDIWMGHQMLPCCGHVMWAEDEELQNVDIQGCANGIDYAVTHKDGKVCIILEDGSQYCVDFPMYFREVLAYAGMVEDFYRSSSPKQLPKDGYERDGYVAFWNEWRRRFDLTKNKL